MAKRKNGGFELLAAMPWPVPLVLGVIGFVVVRYGIGWVMSTSQNAVLAGLGRQLSSGAYTPLAWAVLGICWVAALASYIGAQRRRRLLETQTGLDSIRALSWRQFELLVGEAFRRQGYAVQETGLGGADGGKRPVTPSTHCIGPLLGYAPVPTGAQRWAGVVAGWGRGCGSGGWLAHRWTSGAGRIGCWHGRGSCWAMSRWTGRRSRFATAAARG